MSDREGNWDAGTWDGARRAQLRDSLQLTVRERLRELDGLAETSDRFQARDEVSEPGETGRHVVPLKGCSPTPLASYLKAIGLLRIIAEQADPTVRGWWQDRQFFIRSKLDPTEINHFLLDGYSPTPIIAPWNGGSGFFPKDNTRAIDAIIAGDAARFGPLRATIATARDVLRQMELQAKPNAKTKPRLLERLRAELDEKALEWMDAAVMLGEEGPSYPPLLGTGGNDGRLEFTNNFMQRLVELFDPDTGEATPTAPTLLEEALLSSAVPGLGEFAAGQFSPGAAGGPNLTTSFSADPLVNAWDFVLTFEGAVLFASAATRRLESSDRRALSYPFTVAAVGAGSGATASIDAAPARGEIWMPLWERPVSVVELRALLGEGRATVDGRNAADGVDFARAIAALGVSRGIGAFQRFGFLQRFGRTYLATPLNRVPVRRNATVGLIEELEHFGWLQKFRRYAKRGRAPARLSLLGRRLDDALFGLALRDDVAPQAVQEVLVVLGQSMSYMASSPAARERLAPVPPLAGTWVEQADDGTHEFRIAAALAGIHARRRDSADRRKGPERVLPMVCHIAPVEAPRRKRWDEEAEHLVVWSHGSFEQNLGRILERRLIEAADEGTHLPLHGRFGASIASVVEWISGSLDVRRTSDLFVGLTLTRIPYLIGSPTLRSERRALLPAAYRMFKPLFCPPDQLRDVLGVEEMDAPGIDLRLVRKLASGDVDSAIPIAFRCLRKAGLTWPGHLGGGNVDGGQLLAALMVPLSDHDLRNVLQPLLADVHQRRFNRSEAHDGD